MLGKYILIKAEYQLNNLPKKYTTPGAKIFEEKKKTVTDLGI